MNTFLERLLRTVDPPNPERVEVLWAEYRGGGAGADAAFATILAWYGNPLYRRIWGFVRSDHAEDVFQDMLVKLHRERHKFDTFEHALRWVRTVAVNQAVDARRRAARSMARERRAARPESGKPVDRPDELQEALRVGLGKLPADEREAVALVYFEGMPRQDAAAVLGVHRDTLATRLNDALDRLRKLLPAPVVLAVGGTLAVPAMLTAQAPVLPAARLSELAVGAWATASGRSITKVTLVLVGLSLCGTAAWAVTRGPLAEPHAVADAPRPRAAAVESVADRNLRVFRTEVLPRQLAALRPLALGDGEVELDRVRAFDTRLECDFLIRHKLEGSGGWTSKLTFIHNTMDRGTGVYFTLRYPGDGRPIDTKRPIILWRNPLTGAEKVLAVPALEEARRAFDGLPKDDRTAAEATEHLELMRRAVAPFLGTWYARGDPTGRCVIALTPKDTLEWVAPAGQKGGGPMAALQVDTAGWVSHIPLTPGPARVSADGRRVEFHGSGEWWSRAPVSGRPK